MTPHRTLADHLDERIFSALYSRSLVYNTCWEDPAVDREALLLNPDDVMLVITSAGCNVLDYALTGPARIHAVDANPHQTALLELKLAGIRALEYYDFFCLFGDGHHPDFSHLYRFHLRDQLSGFARNFWDARPAWFTRPKHSFYYRGLAGLVARGFRRYLSLRPKLALHLDRLFDTRSLEEQRHIYDNHVAPVFWGQSVNWVLSRQFTMNLLGVPHPQRRQVEAQHAQGVAGYIRDSLEWVLRQIPIQTNYFWSVYLRGHYTTDCCPEYLKPENFSALQNGLAQRIIPHTATVTGFLKGTQEKISKYVLLDHMDWMSSYHPRDLEEEWREILAHATPDARIIFRSAHRQPAYLDNVTVDSHRLRERLAFHDDLAQDLQTRDRVHTYAGFHICHVPA